MRKVLTSSMMSLAAALMLSGCGEKQVEEKVETSKFESSLILSAQPNDAVSVVEARAQLSKGGDVVVRGDIGGRVPPFVGNRAAFILADQKNIKSCNKTHGDGCKKPWDYCCDDPKKVAASILVIQVLDTNGDVIKETLKGYNDLKELSDVIITGTYDESSSAANVIINATGIYKVK